MKDFNGKLAVVTGGGTGIGRELTVQLAAAGCDVAACDIFADTLAETAALCNDAVRLTTHHCDVSDEAGVLAFRDAVVEQHEAECIHLLFNNAGIGSYASFIDGDREEWERVFGVCWYGVYYCARAFMPLLVASDEGYLVNTSSVNGFWASLGPSVPHTSYCAAKFAVKGFSEALIADLRLHAPHVKVAVVMPGHIGTSIVINSGRVLGAPEPAQLSAEQVARIREQWVAAGLPVGNESDDHIRAAIAQQQLDFRDNAPTTAAQAASIILDGVRQDRWRILVGEDAHILDELVREEPEAAYDNDFTKRMLERGALRALVGQS